MKANGYGSTSKLATEIHQTLNAIKETQAAFQRLTLEMTADFDKVTAKNTELERFIAKQDELNHVLKRQLADT
jgi:hypothetical protein